MAASISARSGLQPSRFGSLRRLPALALCGFMALGLVRNAHAQAAAECEQAGRAAEQALGLPPGLLLAIGRVESGRWDPQFGRVVPRPWSIDAGGESRLLDSETDAIAAVRALQAANSPNVDVGCFQINLAWHPHAFASLAQAFDPQANAQYAARFLVSLRARLGNWQDAVAAYHSATPDLGVPYRQRVFADWNGTLGISPVASVDFTVIAGVRVWGPSPTDAAPQVIATHAPLPSLPRVITPSR